jgi:hypothetical protein
VCWFDSCDQPGAVVEECPDAHAECVEPTATTAECRCLTGFGGPACAVCEVGYQGAACDECADGYALAGELCEYAGWCGADRLWLIDGALPAAVRESAEFSTDGLPAEPTIVDEVTGLEWRRCLDGESWSGSACEGTPAALAQAAAAAQCLGSYGGHADWRLPEVTEALTLLDRAQLPALQAELFSGATDAPVWTATIVAGEVGYWKLDPANAGLAADQADAAVRCVRGDATAGDPPPRFAVGAADGSTVIDAWSGLEWRRCTADATFADAGCGDAPSELGWDAASAACAASFAGHDDWFVPDAVQLGSLADYCDRDPASFVAAFPDGAPAVFWSATGWPTNLDRCCLDSALGEPGWCDADTPHAVRCARRVD